MLSLLDFIFPKKCVGCGKFGEYFCGKCKQKIERVEQPICPVCLREAKGGKTHPKCRSRYSLDGLVFGCKYRGLLKRAISKVKYKWIYDIERGFVNLLSEQFWQFDLPQKSFLIPVPLHSRKENWRGFNQAEVLAKGLAKKFKVGYLDILIRNRETKTQVGLSVIERKENVEGAFSLKSDTKLSGKNLILVDDVFTSGATMVECAKVLKKSGAKSVWAMVLAHG